MSVLLENEVGCIIDHEQFLNKQFYDNHGTSYVFEPFCFSLNFPFYMSSQLNKYVKNMNENHLTSPEEVIEAIKVTQELKSKKRKRQLSSSDMEQHDEEIRLRILTKVEEIIEIGRKNGIFRKPPNEIESINNPEAKSLIQKFKTLSANVDIIFSNVGEEVEFPISLLENQDELSISKYKSIHYTGKHLRVINIESNKFILPANCHFINSDIKDFTRWIKLENKIYDFIVMDPPWSNKSVKRKRGMLNNNCLKELPIKEVASDGAIIAVWVTNNPHHMNFIKEVLFPAWNTKLCAVWHWVKVCTSGDFICSWVAHSKKPYEHLFIGQKSGSTDVVPIKIPDSKLIISVPSAIPSHKPPLEDLFRSYIKKDGNYLELFARNLLTNWTSWGNQVLLLQHIDLYRKVSQR